MTEYCATQSGSTYPRLTIIWTRTPDKCVRPDGWYGTAKYWFDGNTCSNRTWSVSIGQTSPVGMISFDLEPQAYGAAAFESFPGTGITERDLLWATVWALAHIERIYPQELIPPKTESPNGEAAPGGMK